MEEHYKHFTEIHEEFVKPGSKFKLQPNDFKFMFECSVLNGALSTHHSLFISTLRSQSSDEQLGWWLDKALRQEFIGCYAQTEIGIGSNVRGLQTTATFDEATDSFILDTPTLTATKFWNTGLPSCTHCVLYAQLILKGKPMGIHVFFLQIRGADLEPLPGIEILDVGTKMGDGQADIGALRLHNVRIPRVHMLAKRQYVTKTGEYVKVGSGGKSSAKLAYLTMLQTRAGMVSGSGAVLSEAATIAIRYSAVRKQGFVEPSKAQFTSDQNKIIDYPVQRHRLLKALSQAIVMKASGIRMQSLMMEANMEDLTELHATSSILKAHCTTLASHGIEQMRKCCGGLGYLSSAGVSELFCWWVGPFETAEGDPTVLTLQTARFLIKSYQAAKKGEPLPSMTSILSRLKDPAFNPLKQGRPARATAEAIGQCNLQALMDMMEYRSLVCTSLAGSRMEESLKRTKNFDASWNENMRWLHAAATVHGIYFMFRAALDFIATAEDQACRQTLERLVAYFALSEMEDGYQWTGLLTYEDSRAIETALAGLAGKLRNDMVAMVDAFDIADETLNSGTSGR